MQESRRSTGVGKLYPVQLLACVVLTSIGLCFASVPSASALTYGIMSGGEAWQEESQWNAMQKSGASSYRLMVNNIGGWQEKYDKAFRLAAERGITILPYLYNFFGGSQEKPEQYPYSEATGPGGSPWETWVYTVIHRYGANGEFWNANPGVPYKPVPAWEVWNEPNFKENNPGGKSVQPEKYGEFLKRTSAAIQAAQKERTPGVGVPVLHGGLISTGHMSVGEFLNKVKNVSEVGFAFNGLSLHPYSWRSGLSGVQTHVNNARAELSAKFSTTKSLWITELGWNISNEPGETQNWVSVQDQAKYLSQSFDWLEEKEAEKDLNIKTIIYFFYKDTPGGPLKWANYAGLRGSDGSFRPAWYAFQEQTKATAWPIPEWHTSTLGGSVTSEPEINSWGAGRLDVFARGDSNSLEHKWYNGNWSSWEDRGGTLDSGPNAVSWGSDRIDVVARVPVVNTVTHPAWNGSSWITDNLNGSITSTPEISSWGSGRLDVFAKGVGNSLQHKWFDGNWSSWESLGGTLASDPTVVSWGPGRIDVFVRGGDSALWHKWYNGSWSSWESLGGTITSAPVAYSWGSGRLDVFARGGDKALWHKWYNGSWSSWESLGGTIATDPAAVTSWESGRLDVFVKTENKSLEHKWYNGNWSGWENLGGTLESGPSAVSWGKDRIDVVARSSTDDSVTYWSFGLVLPP